eukprot:TRINITY_DN10006_c0_g1_i7.p1 TRINITY_DN10006_c0_g1~~TRINITY_DN10006_c0_g1_i7.p1  ORF type:complete len:206 (-),score=69.67 TRINITY_DN10006_c0_g1_i7:109-726(-)
MDYLKISSLPKILPPRKGRLIHVRRSQDELTPNERSMVEQMLARMFEGKEPAISREDFRILLLQVNLEMSDTLIGEYLALEPKWAKKPLLTFEDFTVFYRDILSNQTPFFRIAYSKDQSYDLPDLPQQNLEDARRVFSVYDDEKKGSISVAELPSIFSDLGYPTEAMSTYFGQLCKRAEESTGTVYFDEFVRVHNEVVDLSKGDA